MANEDPVSYGFNFAEGLLYQLSELRLESDRFRELLIEIMDNSNCYMEMSDELFNKVEEALGRT